MKKIFTILFFVGVGAGAFAQSDRHAQYHNQSNDHANASPAYPGNNGYHGNDQAQHQDQNSYSGNDRAFQNNNDGFNQNRRFEERRMAERRFENERFYREHSRGFFRFRFRFPRRERW